MEKNKLNLNENIYAMIAYSLTWITGIIILSIENKNKYIRFHAMQSIVTFLPLTIISWIFSIIPFIGHVLNKLTNLLILILWIICLIKAYKHEEFKLPISGTIAENFLK